MFDFSDWTPLDPSLGPPLPKNWNIRWPTYADLIPPNPNIGPPLPSVLKVPWPWAPQLAEWTPPWTPPPEIIHVSWPQEQLKLVFE